MLCLKHKPISTLTLNKCPVCESDSIENYIETPAQMHPSKELFKFDKCTTCNFVFLNPRVSVTALSRYYTSHYLPYRGAEAWGVFKGIVERSQKKLDQRKYRLIQGFAKLDAQHTLLDIGCGKPSFLQTCLEKSGCSCVGIDFSDKGWKAHTGRYAGLDLHIAEIQDLDKRIQPDIISMWHYLEHDYSPREHLKHLRSISKDDTKLVIEVPNYDSHSRKKFKEYWAGWHTPRHTSLFSPHNLKLLLEECGWNVKQVLPYGTMDAYVLYWMSKMEQRQVKWDKSLATKFFDFVLGMLRFYPLKRLEKQQPLGIMTVLAEAK